MQRAIRLKKELERLEKSPSPGVSCWFAEDSQTELEANIIGPPDSPFDGGVFKLRIRIPERYPFEPPEVVFVTSVYHPNIDEAGRICLDILKMPPTGSWKASNNISSVLLSIRVLLGDPNPDDPLMVDIAEEFKMDPDLFARKAKNMTMKQARN